MNANPKTHVFLLVGLVVLGILSVYLLYQSHQESLRNQELEVQLKDLTEREKRSAIVRSISTQMEEIAYQQKEVSDKQREEAVQQTRIANDMRQRAEVERRNAQEAEKNALASEQKALEASFLAENQREIAEKQREEAVFARSVADTLSYLALARSLGSVAVTQENTGNHELAGLLAYTSYLFTNRYGGDLYQPAIFEALSLISSNNQTWKVHSGSVMKQTWIDDDGSRFLTISTYGELLQHEFVNGRLSSKTLFSNSVYDIRDVQYYPNGVIYAVSRTGHIIMIRPNGESYVQPIPGAVHPFRIFKLDNLHLAVVAENAIYAVTLGNLEIAKSVILERPVSIVGSRDTGELLLFDKSNTVTVMKGSSFELYTEKLPFSEIVSSYNRLGGYDIYGTTDGVILLVDENGKITRLVGHRSRVSRVSRFPIQIGGNLNSNAFFSTSYDGTVKVWDVNNEKIEPVNVLTTNSWLISSAADRSNIYLWTGDHNGNLIRTLIDVTEMAKRIKSSLTRDFTPEEWAYYIGNSIPFESFLGK